MPIKPPRDGEVTPFCNHLAFEGAGYGLSSAISHHCSVAFFFRPSLEEAPVISWANVFAAKIWIQGHSFWVDSRRRFFLGGLVSNLEMERWISQNAIISISKPKTGGWNTRPNVLAKNPIWIHNHLICEPMTSLVEFHSPVGEWARNSFKSALV